MTDLVDSAILQFQDCNSGVVDDADAVNPAEECLPGHIWTPASIERNLRDLSQAHSRMHDLRRQSIHVNVTAIAYDKSLCTIKKAQTLRHIVKSGVKPCSNLLYFGLPLSGQGLGSTDPVAVSQHPGPSGNELREAAIVRVHRADQQN
jgi:hypothetical protein